MKFEYRLKRFEYRLNGREYRLKNFECRLNGREYRLVKRECGLDECESGLKILECGNTEWSGGLVIRMPGTGVAGSGSSSGRCGTPSPGCRGSVTHSGSKQRSSPHRR